MKVYAIRNKITGHFWSKNRFIAETSIPDLYQSKKNAYRQMNHGKVSLMRKADWCDPEVVSLELRPWQG